MSTPLIRILSAASLAALLAACQQSETPATSGTAEPADDAAIESVDSAAPPAPAAVVDVAGDSLAAVLAAQPAEARARYANRHPAETLEFFGIEPGMTVMEALPGGGWYTRILAPYLGTEGTLVGVDYSTALFPLFGFMSDEDLQAKETWSTDWVAEASAWFDTLVADIEAFQFGSLPERFEGEMDAVLMIRALHNLARFEDEGGFLSAALADTAQALKPGGVVGVVQHMAPEDAPDDWANGGAGYLKKSMVIASFEAAGFELVAESAINENPLDQPTVDDVVWRLPPTLSGSRDDPEAAAAMQAIGESNRMTLLFRKPG
jgi:predicted methyltransferase